MLVKLHQIKSYKCKKHINNAKEDWVIFENTHEPIISQQDFDLVQELRKNKRKIQKCGEVNSFSGMVYCADCGSKMYLCRSIKITELTPEIMHELIERIVAHAPDKSSGHRVQQIDIYYRFNIAVSMAIADGREYDKTRKAA